MAIQANSNGSPLTASERIRISRAVAMLDAIRTAATPQPSIITSTRKVA